MIVKKARSLLNIIFRKNILTLFIVLAVLIFLFSMGFKVYFDYYVLSREKESAYTSVKSFIEMGTNLLISYNKTYQGMIESFIEPLSEKYKESGISGVEEELLKIEIDPYMIDEVNYYLIQEGVITKTNYLPDLGLDIENVVPKFWNFLNEKFEEKDLYIANISYEVNTNTPRLFAYKKIDNEIILEIGLKLKNKNFNMFITNFENLESQFHIGKIEIYNLIFVPFDEGYENLTEADKNYFDELEESYEYIFSRSNIGQEILYVKWTPELESGIHATINMKITMDFSSISKMNQVLLLVSILISAVIAIIYSLITYSNTKKLVGQLLKRIELIKKEDLEGISTTGIQEFDKLQNIYEEQLIEKEKRNKELYMQKEFFEDLSKKDSLTGLLNWNGAQKIIENFFENNDKFSVIYMDIDGLKEINDNFGHSAGDKTLIEFSKILKGLLRKDDYACRLGGDEFIIITKQISQKTIDLMIKRIKKEINDSFRDSNDIRYDFSWGVESSSKYNNSNSIIKAADKKMYLQKNKKKGKDNN